MTPLDLRVEETNSRARELIKVMIAIMDGDLATKTTSSLLSASVSEPETGYQASVGESRFHEPNRIDDIAIDSAQGEARPSVTPKRNPPWTRDEIILATAIYIQNDGRVLGPNDFDVIALSKLLNDLSVIPMECRNEKFRNPEGVGLKLSNIRAADPDRPGGSPHGNRLDGLFWGEFGGDKQLLFAEAKRIRDRFSS